VSSRERLAFKVPGRYRLPAGALVTLGWVQTLAFFVYLPSHEEYWDWGDASGGGAGELIVVPYMAAVIIFSTVATAKYARRRDWWALALVCVSLWAGAWLVLQLPLLAGFRLLFLVVPALLTLLLLRSFRVVVREALAAGSVPREGNSPP